MTSLFLVISLNPIIIDNNTMSSITRNSFVRTGLSLAIAGSTMVTAAYADQVHKLQTVIVTAARTAQTVDETLAPVTVIDREEIERSQTKSLTELLRTTPDIQITENGGQGAQTSIFTRGTNSNHTLVIVDGVRINSATGGQPSIPYLDPDQIEKIEIVRGPKSSLYGADAIGGIIHIFTRKGAGEPRLTIKAGAGSHSSNSLDFNLGGRVENTSFNVNAGLYETEGFDRTVASIDQNDDDAYRNKSGSINISHDLSNDIQIGASIVHNQGKSEYDSGSTESYTKFKNTVWNGYFKQSINDVCDSKIDIGYSVDDNPQYSKSADGITTKGNFFGTKRQTLAWQNDIFWSASQALTVGLDYYKDKVDDSNQYIDPENGKEVDSRSNRAVFVQNQSDLDWSSLSVSLRTDDNEAYGSYTTGNVAWGIQLPQQMKLIASYGTAYRAPTMYELYAPENNYGGAVTYRGNPHLEPEHSESYDLQLKGSYESWNWSTTIFQNNIKDLIDYKTVANVSEPMNVDKARIKGLELTLAAGFDSWSVNSNLSFLDPKDSSTGKILLKRARRTLNVGADKHFGGFSIGGELRAVSRTVHYGGEKAPGYGVVDLRASMGISNSLRVEGKLVNVFDKFYQTTLGYNPEPRGVFATVVWSPEM